MSGFKDLYILKSACCMSKYTQFKQLKCIKYLLSTGETRDIVRPAAKFLVLSQSLVELILHLQHIKMIIKSYMITNGTPSLFVH